ncbi:MAG TPA: hypothetical protein VH252_05970 [Chthoniobacterales bacterium]|nr:hypothetical protein [Chthoniobacterales bacterium]
MSCGRSDGDYWWTVRFIAKFLSLIPLAAGFALLTLGILRYQLSYENGRYFDPQTQVVYHLQAAEFYLVTGGLVTLVGLGLAFVCFRLMASRRPPQLQ